MAKEITLSIDNRTIQVRDDISILEAADQAGIYIPRLCYHPALPPGPGTRADNKVYRCGEFSADPGSKTEYHGCNICVVNVEGKGILPSCATTVQDGMTIHTDTSPVRQLRMDTLSQLISLHPHACLVCSEREGCDRQACTQGVPEKERCCWKFEGCEFRRVSEYISIRDDVSKYSYRNIPVVEAALFTVNSNLCIGCTRCVRACEKKQGKRVIGFLYHNDEFVLGTRGPSYKESACVYCGACVAVCPAGAIREKGLPWKKKEELHFAPVRLPPEHEQDFNRENIEKVPASSGVYTLLDEKHTVIFIRGAADMRLDLEEKLDTVAKARFFRWEEHGMYSMRENEMVEKYLKQQGRMPEVNDEINDLY